MSLYENWFYIKIKKIYYFLIDILFRKTGMPIEINDFKLRFYPRHYKWFSANYEGDSFEFIKRHVKSKGVCIDIGAHFGIYTLILSKYFNCRVYSYEPTPYTASILLKNIEYNHVAEKVTVFQKAVSAKNGQATFLVQDTAGSVANSLVNYWHSDENKKQVTVDVVSIDSAFENIEYDFLKIDAEGAEYDVLLGATQTVRKYQPIIMLGLHPKAIKANGHSLKLIWDWIVAEGYECQYKNNKISEGYFCAQAELFDVFLLRETSVK